MSEFTVYGGYDTEGMRGHVAVVPPPEPKDIRKLDIFLVNAAMVPEERGSGLELTFATEQRQMVDNATHDVCHDLVEMGHRVVLLEGVRDLKFGEYLLDSAVGIE